MKIRFYLLLNLIALSLSAQKTINTKSVIGTWYFEQITMISPQVGYIPTLEEQEVNLFRICMANYTLNADGSIGLSDEYIRKSGVSKANWKLNEKKTGTDVTYYFILNSELYPRHKQEKETFQWEITSIDENNLILNFLNMFQVKLSRNKT